MITISTLPGFSLWTRRHGGGFVAGLLLASTVACNGALALPPATLYGSPSPQQQQQPHGDPRSLSLNEKGVAAINAGRFDTAEQYFREAVAADPRNLTAAFNLSGTLLNNKKVKEAVSLLEGYTGDYQQDPGLFFRLGDAYLANKQVKESAQAYQKALELDPNYPNLSTRLATTSGLLNKPTDAEKFMKMAVDQNPKDHKTLASYSSLLLGNGKPEDAISAAKRSLQIKPNSEAYITLGTAYEIRGDLKNALISFQRAADLGDARKELKEKIAQLEKRSKV